MVPLKDVSSVEGTKAVLEAKISAQDISSVKWFHNDKLLTASERVQMVAKGAKQRLVFSRTFASDQGRYKLVVGKVDTSCSLAVESESQRVYVSWRSLRSWFWFWFRPTAYNRRPQGLGAAVA